MTRKAVAILAAVALLAVTATASEQAAPAAEAELVACLQIRLDEENCTTVCTYRDANGNPAGFMIYDWCN
jgi:hypothetical protein